MKYTIPNKEVKKMNKYQYSVRLEDEDPIKTVIISGQVEAYSLSQAITFIITRHGEGKITSMTIRRESCMSKSSCTTARTAKHTLLSRLHPTNQNQSAPASKSNAAPDAEQQESEKRSSNSNIT